MTPSDGQRFRSRPRAQLYDDVVHRIHFGLRPNSLQGDDAPLECEMRSRVENDGEYDGEEKTLPTSDMHRKIKIREGRGKMVWPIRADLMSGEMLGERGAISREACARFEPTTLRTYLSRMLTLAVRICHVLAADTYDGMWKGNHREGVGTMSWSIDAGVTATYSGEWKTSLRDGPGWMTWDYARGKGDEASYEGEWKKGMRQGAHAAAQIIPKPWRIYYLGSELGSD